MTETRAIVLPYRYGDCFNALPIARRWDAAGHDVRWVIHSEFADLFDGISYARPIVFTGRMNDMAAAVAAARKALTEEGTEGRVFVLKSGSFSPPIPRPLEHFTAELWERAGEIANYHTWPLEIDRRHPERERALADAFVPTTNKPLLGYCLRGHSFKYGGGQEFEQWLFAANAMYGEQWELVNLADIKAYRIYDMLGILGKLSCLLSIDTAIVHLAKAAGTPTVVIVPERDYDSPEPQRHWIGSVRGSESLRPEGHAKITEWLFGWTQDQRLRRRGYLCRRVERMYAQPMLFGIAAPDGEVSLEAQIAAKRSYLDAQMRDRYWIEADVLMPVGHLSNAQTIDLLLAMSPSAGSAAPCRYLALAPAGVCLAADAPHVLRKPLADGAPCVYSYAVAGPAGGATSTDLPAPHYNSEGGVIAFDIEWWRAHKDEFRQPLTWARLWSDFRRAGVPTETPVAYRPAA